MDSRGALFSRKRPSVSTGQETKCTSVPISLFVWVITFDLSGMGGPASSYATAGIALRII
jgi:hypothetical protein